MKMTLEVVLQCCEAPNPVRVREQDGDDALYVWYLYCKSCKTVLTDKRGVVLNDAIVNSRRVEHQGGW